jgi:hypothetical protein
MEFNLGGGLLLHIRISRTALAFFYVHYIWFIYRDIPQESRWGILDTLDDWRLWASYSFVEVWRAFWEVWNLVSVVSRFFVDRALYYWDIADVMSRLGTFAFP